MSFTYHPPDIPTDVATIKSNVITYLQAYMPAGWRLAPGSLLDLVIEALCIQAAQQNGVIVSQLISQFRYLGALFNVPPIDAVPAVATATFTVQDTTGYTIPAVSSTVGINDSSGVLQGFDLIADLVVPAGQTTAAGMVVAETAGTACNGLAGSAQLVSCPPFVTGCSLTSAVQGVDAEDDTVYLGRLTETLGVLSFVPVLGSNFAVLARSIAGIYRACGVNLLKPGPPYDTAAEATGVSKNVTVAVADINGNPVGATIRNATQIYLQSLREQNFQVWVVDPQYAQIDVQVTVGAWPGVDPTALQAAVSAAISGFLSPALFATDPTGNAARWANDPVVRASQLYQVIMTVQGVRYVDGANLKLGAHGGALATTDFTIGPGSAIPALPTPGTITVTVEATSS